MHEDEIAAEKLNRLLNGKTCDAHPYLNTRKKIIERQSTRLRIPQRKLRQTALQGQDRHDDVGLPPIKA